MSKNKVKIFSINHEINKARGTANHYIKAKHWIRHVMETEKMSLRYLAEICGYKSDSQLQVFVQIIDTVDTNSKIFAPYRLKIQRLINLRRRFDRYSPINPNKK